MQVGLIGHRRSPLLQQVPASVELAGYFRRGLFGVILRASQGWLRCAGRPTTSWTDEHQGEVV